MVLSDDQLDLLQEWLLYEFMGELDDEDEPSLRGRELDRLIPILERMKTTFS